MREPAFNEKRFLIRYVYHVQSIQLSLNSIGKIEFTQNWGVPNNYTYFHTKQRAKRKDLEQKSIQLWFMIKKKLITEILTIKGITKCQFLYG